MPEEGKGQQAKRLIFMLKRFQSGARYSTDEMKQLLDETFGTISIKSVQRDLRLLQEMEPLLENVKSGRKVLWSIPKGFRKPAEIRIENHELLGFYVLKAHLKTFRGTEIEEHISHLKEKLDELAPGDVFAEDSFFWDQNQGQFDYSQYDDILRRVLNSIKDRKWVEIVYDKGQKNERELRVVLQRIFTYSGTLYVSAYVPQHDNHIALKLHGLIAIRNSKDQQGKIPDFDFNEFTRKRFGVFEASDMNRARKVVLKIRKGYEEYFDNRTWHSSQKQYEKDGNLHMEMKVPIVPDLTGWLMSWANIVEVIKPQQLIKELKANLKDALSLYGQ